MIQWTWRTWHNIQHQTRFGQMLIVSIWFWPCSGIWHRCQWKLRIQMTDENADRLPVILNYVLISASAGNITEQDLLQTLLRNYNTNVRPARDPSESVEVAIGVAMKQIVDLVSLPRTLNCHDFAVDLLLNGYSASPIPLSLFVCWLQPHANNITHTHI